MALLLFQHHRHHHHPNNSRELPVQAYMSKFTAAVKVVQTMNKEAHLKVKVMQQTVLSSRPAVIADMPRAVHQQAQHASILIRFKARMEVKVKVMGITVAREIPSRLLVDEGVC